MNTVLILIISNINTLYINYACIILWCLLCYYTVLFTSEDTIMSGQVGGARVRPGIDPRIRISVRYRARIACARNQELISGICLAPSWTLKWHHGYYFPLQSVPTSKDIHL